MKNNSAVSNETIAYFDNEIFELLSIMETITNAPPIKSESLGSVLEMNALELNGPIGGLIETQGDMIHSIRNGSSVGFSDQTGPRFRKFINNIYRTPQIKSKASEAFIKEITFKWLVDTKRSGQAASNFSSYLFQQ